MTNEEAKNTLQIFSQIRGGNEKEAMKIAIKALENQEKYEKALAMACDKISCLYCVLHDSHPCEETHEQCVKRKVQYYKRKAGTEVSGNDE